MGELSEQVINGEICGICLKPIKNNPADVPVACKECWSPACGYLKEGTYEEPDNGH